MATQIEDIIKKGTSNSACRVAVIGASPSIRDGVKAELERCGVNYLPLRSGSPLSEQVVKIDTIESMKGHEFTHVFLVGVVEGILPRDDQMDEDGLSREASRLYVAMTRARDFLYLSYTVEGGYRGSRFLTAISEECDEWDWNGYILLKKE